MPPSSGPVAPAIHDVAAQFLAIKTLQGLPVVDAIGAACAFLLHCAETQPTMTRRVLRERIIRNGFSGSSLLETLRQL